MPLYFERLFKVKGLFEDNKDRLVEYLLQDPKGKLVPSYLLELLTHLESTYKKNREEFFKLEMHLDHIKDIVVLQKSIGGTSTLMGKVNMQDLLETAINMTVSLSKNGIKVLKKYGKLKDIVTDRSMVLQICVNLL